MARNLKIQYLSDLHFEFGYNRNLFHKQKYRKVHGDILVIAGDLDYLGKFGKYSNYTREYLTWVRDNYERVYILCTLCLRRINPTNYSTIIRTS